MATRKQAARNPRTDTDMVQSAPLLEPFEIRHSWSLEEFSIRHGCSWDYIWSEIQAGNLPAARLGGPNGPWRITRDGERQWIRIYHPDPSKLEVA